VLESAVRRGEADAGMTAVLSRRFHAIAELDVIAREHQLGLGLGGDLLENPLRGRVLLHGNSGDILLEDTRFFLRDVGQLRTELVHVVHRDARQATHFGFQDVGAVQPTAQAGFHDGDIHVLRSEIDKRNRGHDFEEGRLIVLHPLHVRGDFHNQLRQCRTRNLVSVDRNPLANVANVRRHVQTDAMPTGLEHRSEHRRGRTLALGTGDMHGFQLIVGVIQPF